MRKPGAVSATDPSTPDEFFAGHPERMAVFEHIQSVLQSLGPLEVRVSRSQVAFRRRRGFAYLWTPQQYLGERAAGLVLAVALGREDRSPRWKQVAHPAPRQWLHHLVLHGAEDIDAEVVDWLREAADRAE